jgi:FkbM family methyltransferase
MSSPKEGWIVLDAGAYIGLYSLRASRLVGPEEFIVAFEPNPYAFYWLESNLKLNGVKNVKALPML